MVLGGLTDNCLYSLYIMGSNAVQNNHINVFVHSIYLLSLNDLFLPLTPTTTSRAPHTFRVYTNVLVGVPCADAHFEEGIVSSRPPSE